MGLIKNQETLNCPSDQQEVVYASPTIYESPQIQSNFKSNSYKTSKNNSPSENQNAENFSMNSPSNAKINARYLFNRKFAIVNQTQDKNLDKTSPLGKNPELPSQLKHHPTFSNLPNQHHYGSVHSIKNPATQTQMKEVKDLQTNKNRTVKSVFSGTNLKINEKNIFDRNLFQPKPFNLPTSLEKKPNFELKEMFSVAFPPHEQSQFAKQKNYEQQKIADLKINDQKFNPLTIQSIKSVPTRRQIDFSIFEKIV